MEVKLNKKTLNAGIMECCMQQAGVNFTLEVTGDDISKMSKHKALEDMKCIDLKGDMFRLSYSCKKVILTIGSQSKILKER